MEIKDSNSKYLKIVCTILFIIGNWKYLPIMNVPNRLIGFLQSNTIIISIIVLFLLGVLFFIFKKKYILAVFITIVIFIIFSSQLRELSNRYIYHINKGKPIEEQKNVLLGTMQVKNRNSVCYVWAVPFGSEELVYCPHHKLETNDDYKEIIIVIDSDWYISRIPPIE